jgi:hypothetical protein
MPPNRHKWQAGSPADAAEMTQMPRDVPVCLPLCNLCAVAADVREEIAENANTNAINRQERQDQCREQG